MATYGVMDYGVMDADSCAPVTEATVLEAASLSKPVFASLPMQPADFGSLARFENLVAWTATPCLVGCSLSSRTCTRKFTMMTGVLRNQRG